MPLNSSGIVMAELVTAWAPVYPAFRRLTGDCLVVITAGITQSPAGKRQAATVVKIMFNSSLLLHISVTGLTAYGLCSTLTRFPQTDPASQICFRGITKFTNHGSQFSAVFKVKLNCAEPLCFSKINGVNLSAYATKNYHRPSLSEMASRDDVDNKLRRHYGGL